MGNKKIHFVKMHGLGNDYIYVDTALYPIENPREAVIAWSKPHFGVGSDGLILIGHSPDADFTMRLFNADGTEGQMCGNGSRCVGKFVYDRGLTTKTCVSLLTGAGIKMLDLAIGDDGKVASVTVDMMEPILDDSSQYLTSGDPLPEGVFVSMGCPHYVIFVDDITQVNLEKVGPKLEYHSRFPERCNIDFVQVREDGLRMRVWERGSGITMACGTGACATVVAAALTGRSARCSRVIMDGGSAYVDWRESDNHIYLKGPATTVFEGDIDLP